jgi:hypothetical protein
MMTPTNPTLLALCRRAEKLGGPEVPGLTVEIEVYENGFHEYVTHEVSLPTEERAAVLRDHAAGDVRAWAWKDKGYKIVLDEREPGEYDWSVECAGGAVVGSRTPERLPWPAAILASLSAALDLIDEEGDDGDD